MFVTTSRLVLARTSHIDQCRPLNIGHPSLPQAAKACLAEYNVERMQWTAYSETHIKRTPSLSVKSSIRNVHFRNIPKFHCDKFTDI